LQAEGLSTEVFISGANSLRKIHCATLAQQLRRRVGLKVERALERAGDFACHPFGIAGEKARHSLETVQGLVHEIREGIGRAGTRRFSLRYSGGDPSALSVR
jgi:hypothetical protein